VSEHFMSGSFPLLDNDAAVWRKAAHYMAWENPTQAVAELLWLRGNVVEYI